MALHCMGKLRHEGKTDSAFVSFFDGLPFAMGMSKQWERQAFKLPVMALWLYFLMMGLLI